MAFDPVPDSRGPGTQITEHDLVSVRETVLPLLHRYLPYTIDIYRRLQFHLLHPNQPHAKVFSVFPAGVTADSLLATPLDITSSSAEVENQQDAEEATKAAEPKPAPDWVRGQAQNDHGGDLPWMIVHIDVSRLTETTAVIFSSLGLPGAPERLQQATLSQLSTLFQYIRDELIPTRPEVAPPGWPWGKQMKKAEYKRSRILLGALQEEVLSVAKRLAEASSSSLTAGESITEKGSDDRPVPLRVSIFRSDFLYIKYIFPRQIYEHGQSSAAEPTLRSTTNDNNNPPPPSTALTFGTLSQTSEFNLVLDRSHIPRTVATLASLPNIGIYPKSTTLTTATTNEPISWCFLGYDGSLTSLHVEPAYRGQRLAEQVSRALFANMEAFYRGAAESLASNPPTTANTPIKDAGWAHANVHETNAQSRRVMEKLGAGLGREGWKVSWTEVDVEAE